MGNLVTKKEGNMGNDVFDLGPAQIGWGITTDNWFGGARWIWNIAKANDGTPSNVIIKFSKTFIHDGPTVVGWYHICVDDIGYIDCNSYPIINNSGTFYNITKCSGGWGNKNGNSYTGIHKNIQILNGTNRVNIYAMNTGGPSGLIANIVAPNVGSLELTDGSWKSKIMNSYQNVVDLGDVYSSVKGKDYASLFKSAKFIWSDKNSPDSNSDNNTSPNVYVKFSYIFYYKSVNGVSEKGTCNIAVNDDCYLYMNCEQLDNQKGYLTSNSINVNTIGKNISVQYVDGINFIDIIVKNTKPNASLIGAFYNLNGDTILVTNNQWTYSIIPVQSTTGNVYSMGSIPEKHIMFKKPIMASCYEDIGTCPIWTSKEVPNGNTVIFTYTFNHTGEATTGYCYIIVAGTCDFYMNNDKSVNVSYGALLWKENSQQNTYKDRNTYNEFKLKQGPNKITIVTKVPFLASFYDNNDNVIAYTNKSWNYSIPLSNIPKLDPSVPNSFKKMNQIEGFSFKKNQFEEFSLTRKEGFVNLTTWNFPNSVDWYKVVQNGYSIKMAETGIKLPTRDFSISFLYQLTGLNSNWNNIFHISNTGNNCCNAGDRIPALWVFPNDTSFHLRFSTDNNGNDGMDGAPIPLNQITLITLVFNNNTATMYHGNKSVLQNSFNNIHLIQPSATLWIGDPWHGNNGTIQIKGFTIYDGALTQGQVNNLFINTQKGDSGIDGVDGTPGQKGDIGTTGEKGKDGLPGKDGTNGAPGTNGLPGNPGKDGINGAKGDPGTAGKDGTPGSKGEKGDPGKDGSAGKNGVDGQKGDPGIAGEKGAKGDKGTPGTTNSRSALKPGVEVNTNIDRIKTINNTYAYCLGGTIKCEDSTPVPITDDYKSGSTYDYLCANQNAQSYCLNGIGEMPDRAYISPFPFSNSYRGFTVETAEYLPYVYDLGTNNIMYYSNNQLVASDDICNYLTDTYANDKCNQLNKKK